MNHLKTAGDANRYAYSDDNEEVEGGRTDDSARSEISSLEAIAEDLDDGKQDL